MYVSRTIIDINTSDTTDPIEMISICPILFMLLVACIEFQVPPVSPLVVGSVMNITLLHL